MISRRDVLRTAFSICLVIGIVFIGIVYITFGGDNAWNDSNIEGYKNWYLLDNDKKVYIDTYKKSNIGDFSAKDFTIYNELPSVTDGKSLFFKAYHQTVEVFVDNELIYSFGSTIELPFGKSVGSGYHLVRLSSDYANKAIAIRMTSPYDSGVRKIPQIAMGAADSILITYIKSQFGAVAINFAIMLIGLMFIGSEIEINKGLRSKKALYLGVFAICYSMWSFLQTNIIQFFYDNQILIMYMSYLMVMLMPISVVMLVREYYKMYSEKVFDLLICLYMINFIVSIVLQIANLVDLKNMLVITHILMVISIIYIVYVIVKKRHLNTIVASNTTKFLSAVVCGTVIVDLYRYYFADVWDTTRFSRISILVLMLIFSINYLKSYIEKAGKYTEARLLAKLAYRDVMTDMFNRTAYSEDIALIEQNLQKSDTENIVYILFDLNNLKKTNDIHGHTVGDYYIVSMSKIIKKVFEKLGKCYRIGGDEFAVIIKNQSIENCEDAFRELEEMVITKNEELEFEFSIAYGYSATLMKDFTSMQSLITEADKNMYANKRMYKMSATTPVVQY